MSQILCISGMHRSGTSLVASWLNRCGLTISDGQLLQPSKNNPKGYYEDSDFVDLHSSAIRLANPNSKGWNITPKHTLKFSTAHLSMAKILIDNRNMKYEVWGWKDPRTVVFLEHWKEMLPELKVLLIWRPCAQVVSSLIQRNKRVRYDGNKINLPESIALWRFYGNKICEYREKYPTDTLLFSCFDFVNHAENILKIINQKYAIKLAYHPIENIFDQKSFHSRATFITHLVSYFYQVSRIEHRLTKLSDYCETNE